MAARKDQAQPVILRRTRNGLGGFRVNIFLRVLEFEKLLERVALAPENLVAAKPVDRLAAGRRRDPGTWPRGNAIVRAR